MPAISADSLYKVFGKRSEKAVRMLADGSSVDDVRKLGATPAVIDVSFDVEPGEIFVVMGLSGSGKSTLIRMLNGLLEPTSGSVEVDGTALTGMRTKELRELRRKKVSMVFQHFALFPHRTVLENAAYGLQVKGVDDKTRREKAVHSLEMVGLEGWGDFLPGQLSGGMRQRVGLARALAAETDVVLMDEAFSALDPLIRREMQDQLLELQSRLGKTIVFITHDLNEAMRLGDRIAVMRDGRVVQIGTAEDILTDPANDYVAQFVQDVDRTRVLTASSVMEPARALTDGGSGPRAASRIMREQQTTAAFVTGRDRRLLGAVRDEVVDEAVRASDQRKLSELADADVVKVSPDTPLVELFAPAAEHRLPLAVVDAEDRLLGVIPRVTLLHALGAIGTEGNGSEDTGQAASPAPAPEEPAQEASAHEGEARADV